MKQSAVLLVVVAGASVARADTSQCRVVDVDFTPSDQLQIVAWVETAAGQYVDTIYITNKVGRYGIANRPGRFDFNSGPVVNDMWPYGRRITVFPVWAHRHGLSWPEVVFQSGSDDDLSHQAINSTPESVPPFCRPMDPTDPMDQPKWDAGTCASPTSVFTDKGVFSPTGTSLYPPRSDLAFSCTGDGCDSPSVPLYKQMNPFDAVSQATPLAGMATEIAWPIPAALAQGDYVLFVEVAKEFDFNATYNPTTYPSPMVPYGSYGVPYRGQPSIVYKVPFSVGTSDQTSSTQSYAGYGDPDGATGTLNAPDATITSDTPQTGAFRLEPMAGGGELVRVCARPNVTSAPPGPIEGLAVSNLTSSSASVAFVAPQVSGTTCAGAPITSVAGYDIRYLANTELTADNFAGANQLAAAVPPLATGSAQTFDLAGLLPLTDYWVGVRAYDSCHDDSPLAVVHFTTLDRQPGSVNACFIATAAYGSLMANDVEPLRAFRDNVLRTSVLGELALETYYTFSPPVAGVIGESELLRATARDALAPIVRAVKAR